ncbi:MAG TPA: hypothetical protein VK524_25795 [Polyangiaceae bacterium]|nr:hypothetical protein [Polyangiaceae bacterium]
MLERPRFQPSAALAAYAEPLVSGHAVLVIGDATSGLGELLLERGARLIHVYDRDPARAAEASARNTSNRISIAPYGDGGLALRDAAFELALVENLSETADPAAALRAVRRALGARGAAFVATANPDVRVRLLPSAPASSSSVSFDYYGLYDAVSDHFAHVRMLGQTPFVGYAVVDFAPDGEPSPTIDTDFLKQGAEEPEWFIAFGASKAQALNNFTLVQLPLASSAPASPAKRLEEQLAAAQAAERRARVRVAELESVQERPPRTESAAPPPIANDAIHKALEQRDNWIAQLEARAVTADMRADESEGELDTLRERVAELEAQANSARTDADQLRAELATLAAEKQSAELELDALRTLLEEQRAAAKAFEGALAGREARHSELAAQLENETERELGALEAQLQARGTEIQRLYRELREAERFGRELVTDLLARNGASEPAPAADLSTKLDALAALNAQREADLAAAHWAIEKLEGELEERLSGDPGAETLVNQLSEARAVLQRQAVLLEQARQHATPQGTERGTSPLTNPDERSLTE